MAGPEIEKLNDLDVTKITLSDAFAVKNEVLRRIILDAISDAARATDHQSHAAHSSHHKSIVMERAEDSAPRQ